MRRRVRCCDVPPPVDLRLVAFHCEAVAPVMATRTGKNADQSFSCNELSEPTILPSARIHAPPGRWGAMNHSCGRRRCALIPRLFMATAIPRFDHRDSRRRCPKVSGLRCGKNRKTDIGGRMHIALLPVALAGVVLALSMRVRQATLVTRRPFDDLVCMGDLFIRGPWRSPNFTRASCLRSDQH